MISQDTSAVDGSSADLRNESPHVREALSALGRLLGAALSDGPHDLTSFVANHLRTGPGDVAAVVSRLRGVDGPLVKVAVARLLESARSAVMADDEGSGAPGFELVTVDVDEQVSAPDDFAAYVPAGDIFDFDVVVVLSWDYNIDKIALYARREDHEQARGALAGLLARARGPENFYRGKTLRVDATDTGLRLTPINPVPANRAELVLPATVWAEVDANVRGLVEHGDVLATAGLGAARGLLVVGSPGVGKTALCRVIAAELPRGTTVLLVDAVVSARGLGLLYEALPQLAPAAVFLDDIDLLAGDRRGGSGGAVLRELLTHLDGFAPNDAVLTVATTNDIAAIDPALIRAGRFDSVVEIGRPDHAARMRILRGYLAPFADIDVIRLADRTEGASGSDLREVVRRAILEKGPAITEQHLLEVVQSGRWKPAAPTGQYL